MCGQFGDQTRTQALKGLGMFVFDVRLFGQLSVYGFDNLAHRVEGAAEGRRNLDFPVLARQGQQTQVVEPQQTRRDRTPTMALGITDRVMTVGDILRTPLIPLAA